MRLEPGIEESTDDAVLLEMARRGNGPAFDLFVTRHRARIIRVARGMVSDQEDAVELAQEAFIKAHGSLTRFRGDCSPRTWLDRIIVNLCVDWQRRQRVRRKLFVLPRGGEDYEPSPEGSAAETSWQSDPERVADSARIGNTVKRVLAGLPATQRMAFVLRHYEGYDTAELAAALKCAEGTAKVHLHRATQRMRKALAPFVRAED
ncbi:RNA polymerase sigma factor [Candidatus Fermentibacteria bacterium]|nr:RNA polymerase sigma factor [Candidatus Fermentibacteria bacterium]